MVAFARLLVLAKTCFLLSYDASHHIETNAKNEKETENEKGKRIKQEITPPPEYDVPTKLLPLHYSFFYFPPQTPHNSEPSVVTPVPPSATTRMNLRKISRFVSIASHWFNSFALPLSFANPLVKWIEHSVQATKFLGSLTGL